MAVCEMEFKEDDSEAEIQHKLKMLEIYNKRLDEVSSNRGVTKPVCVWVQVILSAGHSAEA